jgi:6-phosphofructokinase 2
MQQIVTVTLNSSIDVQWEVDEMVPVRKLRASDPLNFPGGGGINVSRVIKELGGHSIAVFTAGGFTGHFLREMVDTHGLVTRVISIAGPTRASATVFERSTGHEYRVTPPGPELSETEWTRCLDAVFQLDADYLVLTGSLPKGVPHDFYARIAHLAKERGVRVVLDTSGMALFDALKEGVYLVKPNLRELEHLTRRKATRPEDQEVLTRQLVDEGKAEVVALTLGDEGALLMHREGVKRLHTPRVNVKSTVGAGDSFVAGMTYGLALGWTTEDAFTLGVATGTATVLTAGTQLCHREDVERFYEAIGGKPLNLMSEVSLSKEAR